MMGNLTEQQLMEIARQLGKPEGADGIVTAERMAHTNSNMTKIVIDALGIAKGDVVLEIGPGNGTHLKYLMTRASDIHYYGVDISETMVAEANKINEAEVNKGQVSFSLTAANKLSFSDGFFDKIFTVNTLYFWEDPIAYAMEIRRVLKPDGLFCLAIGTREFMKKLPFTKYRFKLYDAADAGKLLRDAGFTVTALTEQKDLTTSHTGEVVDRDIIILTARKD